MSGQDLNGGWATTPKSGSAVQDVDAATGKGSAGELKGGSFVRLLEALTTDHPLLEEVEWPSQNGGPQ